MEFFTIFTIVTVAVFVMVAGMVAGMGMWSSGVFDSDISKLKREHKRQEKIARETERHIRAMVAARK